MGEKQLGFADYHQSSAKKRTGREKFHAEMELVMPWNILIDLIDPYYPRTSSTGDRPALSI
jgi:IS5 family transposase